MGSQPARRRGGDGGGGASSAGLRQVLLERGRRSYGVTGERGVPRGWCVLLGHPSPLYIGGGAWGTAPPSPRAQPRGERTWTPSPILFLLGLAFFSLP